MRTTITLAVLGILSSISLAQAATEPEPVSTNTPGEFACRFSGRDYYQDNGLRCFVRGSLCQMNTPVSGVNQPACASSEKGLVVRCSNGYELESRDVAIGYDNNNIWINADRRGRIATLRIDAAPLTASNGELARANLVLTNAVVHQLYGHCRLGNVMGADGTEEGSMSLQ